MTKLISFDELSDSSSRSHDWVQAQFKRNTFYASLILMVDAALLYRSAMSLERDVEARNDSIRCQVSEMMDKFLGHPKIRRTSTTNTPVLVSLLYLIASICCIGGLVSIALRVHGASTHFSDHCSHMKRREHKEQNQEKDVPGLPAELQSWAKDSLWSRGGTYMCRNSGRSSGDAIGRDQRESVMRGVRRNPGSSSSTTTWESTRGSGASQREHDEHKDGAMAPPQRNERPTDGGKVGRWFVALIRSGGQSEDAASFNYTQT